MKYCSTASNGYYVSSGTVYSCSNQASCAAYSTSDACLSGNVKYCSTASNGYYVSSGTVYGCSNQAGCATHNTNVVCVSTSKYYCNTPSNGYYLSSGIVQGTCTSQSNCAAHNTNAACVLTSKYQCTAPNNGYYLGSGGTVFTSSFETDFDGWTTGGFGYSLTRKSGSTGSSSTGPQGAAVGSYYVYAETSSLYNKDFDLQRTVTAGSVPHLAFQYHMYGALMGTAILEAYTGTSWVTAWTKSGNLGNSWRQASVTVASGATILRFKCVPKCCRAYRRAIRVSHHPLPYSASHFTRYTSMHTCCTGDFALDDIQAVVASVPESCTTQGNCATHNTNAACVLTSKYQCTAPNNGYYVSSGTIQSCTTQSNCATHNTNEACVSTSKYQCTAPDNG